MDLTIEGKLYHDGAFEHGCIGIDKGKIVAIKKILKTDHHIDVGNSLLLPAGIDLHVHFRDPGFTHKEDFSTGSQAAAFGGISCVFDMPNTKPATTSIQALKEKIRVASEKSYVDFGFYAAVCDENIGRIAELSSLCNGFKIFLGSSTHALKLSSQHLRVALMEINRTGKLSLFHAEDEHCLKTHKDVEHTLIDHLRCRAAECEEAAIRHIQNSSQSLSSPLHICHLSSCDGFEMLRKKLGNMSVGVTPHHLFFDVNALKSNQTFYKVNPPIRSSFDRETLWYGVNHGLIDVLESDHAPHTKEEKLVDFDTAPSGVPGVETMYPVFLSAMKNKQISLDNLLGLLCERPAQILRLPKGKVEVGRDADLIVVDMKKTEPITAEHLHSRCGWTPFEGFPAIFPSLMFIRGEKVIDSKELLVKPGFGTCVGV
ncbi:MAG: dihydroorotase [Candidatus Thermoplasmatota archaeon]|nr:dihydroorotase [Candidatus Thermoplasmatota archaeon]